jgi:hypothetical protein
LTVALSITTNVQPGQPFLNEVLLLGLKARGLIKCSDMEMGQSDFGQRFARQGRSAPGAKATPRLSWRGIEFCYLAFGYLVILGFVGHKGGSRRAGMLSTTVAMTPIYTLRFPTRGEAHRTAQAATFKLFLCVARSQILR